MIKQAPLNPKHEGEVYLASKVWLGPAHHHEEIELNLVLSGRANILLPGKSYTLRPGSLAWLLPNQDHLLSQNSEDFRMYVIFLHMATVQRHCKRAGVQIPGRSDAQGHHCRLLDTDALTELAGLCHSLAQGRPESYGYKQGLGWLLLRAWEHYRASDNIPVNLDIHPAVEAAAIRLRREPGLQDLRQLARDVGLSPNWLSQLFADQLGMPLVAFRNEQRLRRYREILQETSQLSLAEAAEQAGFPSYTQFYRVHRELTGQSPRDAKHKPEA